MTERSESERAELVALADLIDNATGVEVCTFDPMRLEHKRTHLSDDGIARLGSGLAALRSLAAQDQKPCGWRHPSAGWLHADYDRVNSHCFKDGQKPQAVYLSPPPAAGWDEAIEAAALTARGFNASANSSAMRRFVNAGLIKEVYERDGAIADAIETLRHNAPPDSGAGESDRDENWRDDPSADERWNAGLDFAMQQLCKALDVDPDKVTWDAATETVDGDVQSVIWNILRTRFGEDWNPDAAMPDHGGADAGVVELLPCPFCGDEPEIRKRMDEDIWTHNTVEWTGVHCAECGIGFEWPPGAEPDAKDQWNSRAALSKPAPVAANVHTNSKAIFEARQRGNVFGRFVNEQLKKACDDEVAPVAANASAVLQNDLAEMLRALGMSDAAQPRSPHEVFQSAIAEMKRQIANASADARLRDALERELSGNSGQLRDIVAAAIRGAGSDLCDGDWVSLSEDQKEVWRGDADRALAAIKEYLTTTPALSVHPHANDCDKQGER